MYEHRPVRIINHTGSLIDMLQFHEWPIQVFYVYTSLQVSFFFEMDRDLSVISRSIADSKLEPTHRWGTDLLEGEIDWDQPGRV